jgi:hypothetical protein
MALGVVGRRVIGGALALCLTTAAALADTVADAATDFREGHYAEALSVLEPLARQGNPQAQFWLGTG